LVKEWGALLTTTAKIGNFLINIVMTRKWDVVFTKKNEWSWIMRKNAHYHWNKEKKNIHAQENYHN